MERYYLQLGPESMSNFQQIPGVPFILQTPEAVYVNVSSDQHMSELRTSSKEQMSLHALANDVSYYSPLGS